jgi:hypothetical protein
MIAAFVKQNSHEKEEKNSGNNTDKYGLYILSETIFERHTGQVGNDEFINLSVTIGLTHAFIGTVNRKVFKGIVSENGLWSDSMMTDSSPTRR